ncbi:protein TAPETUM DETERMINANT 1-like [Senna tora]|uniref:Protein TAPETUM DETERMINANT 1-like n=1 Tax=Senna tora TaxID=362788 RepID=A0A834X3M6_9FABA|nr:protein TAPETUM DETERMINANT 1-like [Senna tora]
MAGIIKILGIVLFLGLLAQGINGQCSLSDVSVSQSKTGATVESKPEWAVTITNKCSCVQLNVALTCQGFQTVENVDASILSVSGDDCLVLKPIYGPNPVTFKYAWDYAFPFTPKSSQIACS